MEVNSKPFAKQTTKLPPCCLKFHPLDNRIVFVGTYKLDEVNKLKYGSIEVYEYVEKSSKDNQEYLNALDLVKAIESPTAILDLQFSPFDDNLFATGHSNGVIIFWETTLGQSPSDIQINKLVEYSVFEDPTNLITSIKFSDTLKDRILITSTFGKTVVLKLNNSSISTESTIINTSSVENSPLPISHSIESWIGNFGNFELSNVVFTGGDDLNLISHDIRSNDVIFQTANIHQAGITSILTATPGDHNGNGCWKSNGNHFQLATGGYDDTLKLSDLRYLPGSEGQGSTLLPYPPRARNEKNLGGGVWRLTPFKNTADKLMVCCMYDGAKIVTADDGSANEDVIKIDRVFRKNHTSMVYGGDTSLKDDLMATCSFYDCSLQIWSPEIVDEYSN
ncbi:diphthamide synthase [Saccharomycopsis crataegensis]|uniref:methylated diphthine methylhydrolase n=1 Tax=Saccharomycopsis crataegensis TaxID=43959 RepID=A0AAV5QSC6_9ASCO|nr:diphthamide synthase [Saccharomycopsis crataegensis]